MPPGSSLSHQTFVWVVPQINHHQNQGTLIEIKDMLVYICAKDRFVGELHMDRLHCLIKCFPLFFYFFYFFYEISLIQRPEGIQKGSGHFSEVPLAENHF